MKFVVAVQEVHTQPVEIDADSPEEARRRVAAGEGDWDGAECEYSYMLKPELWIVERAV